MSRYTRPDIGTNDLAYRGRRYWLVAISPDGTFEFSDISDCDYVLYDRLYGAVIALVNDIDGGRYSGNIMSHVDLGTSEFCSLPDAVDGLAAQTEWYAKSISE